MCAFITCVLVLLCTGHRGSILSFQLLLMMTAMMIITTTAWVMDSISRSGLMIITSRYEIHWVLFFYILRDLRGYWYCFERYEILSLVLLRYSLRSLFLMWVYVLFAQGSSFWKGFANDFTSLFSATINVFWKAN